ncbi:class I SAM-dependent methyltransferase [Priestia megaterium]|uniref:class I SAM-dependent methyltransferase n=1 Tax=Priestia megaterium TaxID=1404 RepID=UPI0007624699|nr:class I SAM-dependent methyltransferase [Priestia megaterium]KWU59979.1 phosphatidylethanolamine N-methyltransferase [Priestia megaterium]
MNNRWNHFIYRCWAPFYDVFFNHGIFYKARKQVFQDVLFKPKQRVLFVGIGTGADLTFIPYNDLQVKAIDYSEEMLQKAQDKYKNSSIEFLQMDAQELDFESNSFDIVVASLLLSVVPNPNMSLKEMIRVTKDKGTILIFDKFEPTNKQLSFGKKMFRPLIKLLGTDIGLSFETVYKNVENQCEIQEDLDVMVKGLYRKIILQKKGD